MNSLPFSREVRMREGRTLEKSRDEERKILERLANYMLRKITYQERLQLMAVEVFGETR